MLSERDRYVEEIFNRDDKNCPKIFTQLQWPGQCTGLDEIMKGRRIKACRQLQELLSKTPHSAKQEGGEADSVGKLHLGASHMPSCPSPLFYSLSTFAFCWWFVSVFVVSTYKRKQTSLSESSLLINMVSSN